MSRAFGVVSQLVWDRALGVGGQFVAELIVSSDAAGKAEICEFFLAGIIGACAESRQYSTQAIKKMFEGK